MRGQLAPPRPRLEPPREQAAARRMGGAVDAFEPSGPVEGVEASAGPARIAVQRAMHRLRKSLLIEAGDLRETDAGAIPAAAVLHRTPPFPVGHDDGAGGPGAALVDQYRIRRMGLPWSAQIRRREQGERIVPRSGTVAGRGKHPEPAVVADDGRVARLDVGEERRFANPTVGKWIGAI